MSKGQHRMVEDIRDKKFVTHEDVVALNFIQTDSPYIFRRHHRQGLRSHVLEVLHRRDVDREKTGIVIDGTRWFPKAEPAHVFRIFRTRLQTLESALGEIGRVKIVERFLAPQFLAQSNEFIADYDGPAGREPLLCGFQSYVRGEIVDPWSLLDLRAFTHCLFDALQPSLHNPAMTRALWTTRTGHKAAAFIDRVREMILQTGYVPDLAGIGNLVITATGDIKLVDINNISRVCFDSDVALDDRGYPVGDKSIEALYLLEKKLAGRAVSKEDPIYNAIFDPQRQIAVRAHETRFYRKKKHLEGYPSLQQ
jgi:hypothetical protein